MQSSPFNGASQGQSTGELIGMFVGGLVLTRLVTWVIRQVLVASKVPKQTAILVSGVGTILLCSLLLSLSPGRLYPYNLFAVYSVCSAIWMGFDLARLKMRSADKDSAAHQ